MKKTALILLSMLCMAGHTLAADPPGEPLVPRRPANKDSARLSAEVPIESVVIKFHEGTHIRLRGKSLAAFARTAREDQQLVKAGLSAMQVENEVRAVQAILASSGQFRGLERLFSVDEETLAARRAAGEARSGRELADLDLYYLVRVPEGAKHGDVETLLESLNAIPSVEIAYAPPPPQLSADIPPVTPNFEPNQGYLGPAPLGIDAHYAWSVGGGRGQGTFIVDVEGAWRTTHEDLPPLFHQGGTQINDLSWRNHGTAVLGIMVAPANGYGMTGIANGASAGYESVGSQSTASAITNAAIAAGTSGLVVIPLQTAGPSTPNSPCNCSSNCDFVPVEYGQATYDAIAGATANGTIVVEAGGNGATNLDDSVYGGLFNRMVRDSGAILVGASESNSRNPTCFTNYGSRIDMHGWGWNVATLGYGNLFNPNNDENQRYTGGFNGTSSASPIVTGAASAVIGVSLADAQGHGYRTPAEIRQILTATGTPQACCDPRNIGPMPNLRNAIPRVLDRRPVANIQPIACTGLVCNADASNSSDDHGITGYAWNWGDNTTSSGGPLTSHTYAAPGVYPVTLIVYDSQNQSGSTTVNVNLPTIPGNFVATASTTTSVVLTWTASGGSPSYVIEKRSSHLGAWGPVQTTTATSFTESGLAPLTTYEYRIKAVASGSSGFAFDHATTVVFGADLQRSVSTIAGGHVRDLRDAVDAWRVFAGLSSIYPANPVATGSIKAANFVTNLSSDPLPGVFTAFNEARTAMSLPPFAYSGVPSPAVGGPVRLEHVQQLRDVLR
jgi:serine protease